MSVKDLKKVEGSREKLCEDDEAPKDRFKFIYWSVMFWGVISVLPWDTMVTVTSYWHAKLSPDDDSGSNDLTDAQKDFLSYLGIAVLVPNTCLIIAYIFVGHISTVHTKLIIALTGLICTFTVIMVLAAVDTSEWIDGFMLFNIILTAILSIFRALFRATTIKHLGKFPISYLGNLQKGMCVGGLVPVLANLVILSMDIDMEMAGFGCFFFICSLCVLCLVIFFFMERNSFYQYYSALAIAKAKDSEENVDKLTKETFVKLLKLAWIYLLSCLFLGSSTQSVYPGVASLIEPAEPNGSRWQDVYFVQILCFLTWNVMQYSGSIVCSALKTDGTTRRAQILTCIASGCRLVFVPLFMMCNVTPGNRNTEVYIESEYAYLGIMIVFAFSDGYLRTQVLMHGPKLAEEPSEQDALASILVAAVNASYAIGSLGGLLVISIL